MKLFIYLLTLFTTITLYANNVTLEQKIFIDEENTLTIEDIYKNKEKLFEPIDKTSYGIKNITIWISLKVENNSDKLEERISSFPYTLLDSIHYYEFENGKLINNLLTGDKYNHNTRPLNSNDFSFKYDVSPNTQKEIIFKIKTNGSFNVEMKHFNYAEYIEYDKNTMIMISIYYGAVMIMLIYNFILFIMIKEKIYLEYVFFHLTYIFVQVIQNGIAFSILWPQLPIINEYIFLFFVLLANLFAVRFTIAFLEITPNQKIYRYFKTIINLNIIGLGLNFILEYKFIAGFTALMSITSVTSMFLYGVYALFKYRTDFTKFFVTAWGFLLVGVLLTDFQNVGLLPMNFFTQNGSQIGAFIELALFSFALAYRYNIIFNKLQKTESALRVLNSELEIQVEKRTESLSIEISNKNTLLRELFHRVKNNLQIISGLLSLQVKRVKDPIAKRTIVESTQRIKAMSLLHEKIYQSDNLQSINIELYIKSLIESIEKKSSYKNNVITSKKNIPK